MPCVVSHSNHYDKLSLIVTRGLSQYKDVVLTVQEFLL